MTEQPKDTRAEALEAEAPETAAAPEAAATGETPEAAPGQILAHEGDVTVIQSEDDPDQVVIRTRVRKRGKRRSGKKGMSRGKKALLIVIIVVLVLALVAAGTIAWLVHSGKLSMHEDFNGADTPETVNTTNGGTTIEYDGHTYAYNENVVTILLLGTDDESSLNASRPDAKCADVNLLLAFDTSTNKLTVVAVPRDAQVDVDRYDDGKYADTVPLQLCLAYSVDVDTEAECAQNSVKSASRIFYDLPISNYFSMNEDAFVELSNAVGGVELKAHDTYPGASFEKGDTVVLQGQAAYDYIHYRDIDVDYSAQARQKRQVQFAQAFLKKLKSLSASELVGLYSTIKDNSLTDLGASELAYLASCFAGNGGASTAFTSIEGKTKFMIDADGVEREHVFLDDDSVLQAVLAAYYMQTD